MDTREWLAKNYVDIVRIVHHKFRFSDKNLYDDMVQYVCYRMISNDAISKYDPNKSSLRAYLYTVVIRIVVTYLKRQQFKVMPNSSQIRDDYPDDSNWIQESDNRLDVDIMCKWADKNMNKSQVAAARRVLSGERLTHVAKAAGVSRQSVDQLYKKFLEKARLRYG